jgi:type 1 glutamine amidotransferase
MNRDIGSQPGFQILATLAVDNRPIIWIKNVSAGRMFYTVRGHNRDRFDKEPPFRQLVLNGILWATQRLNQ